MNHYKKRQIPAKEEEYIAKVTCDICGVDGKYRHEGAQWEKESYQTNETIILWKKGSNYPEGGSGDAYNIHICPNCFEKKLMPWLRDQGVNLKSEEWEY